MFVTYPAVLQPGLVGLRAGVHGCCPAVSHAIPPEYVASSYHFMMLSHSCLGIACDFGEGGGKWGATGVAGGCAWGAEIPCISRWEEVWAETDDRTKGFRSDA